MVRLRKLYFFFWTSFFYIKQQCFLFSFYLASPNGTPEVIPHCPVEKRCPPLENTILFALEETPPAITQSDFTCCDQFEVCLEVNETYHCHEDPAYHSSGKFNFSFFTHRLNWSIHQKTLWRYYRKSLGSRYRFQANCDHFCPVFSNLWATRDFVLVGDFFSAYFVWSIFFHFSFTKS